MDFRDILGQLHGIIDEGKMADIKGKKHTGKYGTDHDTDEEGEEKKRGGQESDATKDSKKWQGAADAAKLVSGGKKASLKDWVESTEEMISERAVSKNQQKFMGMVHAAQKGDKPASKEVAKVAKSMGKKDAKDFASTKHKGLPEKVKESDDVSEAKADPTGSWVVYDGSKVKRFKTRDGAKAYAEKNGGKVASSEHYADKKNMEKTVKEEGSYRGDKPGQSNFKPYSGSPSTPDQERAAMYKKSNIPPELQANNSPDYQNYRKDKDDARIQQRSEQEYKLQTGKDMPKFDEDVTEELKGGQKKLDKNKNGKLDSQDFKMLRKNKIKEGINFTEMMNEKQQKVDEMLEELQQEIAEFKATGNMGDKLRDALDIHSYSKGETLIGEEDDAIGDAIRHSQDVQRDKDMAQSDLYHAQDMSRLGDEGRADARHMKDVSDLRDQSTSDLWRIKDLARDKAMAKSELEENPFSYAAKQAKAHGDDSFSLGGKTFPVKESDEPKLKTTKTDAGSETTSNTGRIKATFEPGKETKVEPVKEASKSYTDDMGPASGYTDEEMKAMDRQVSKAQEVNRKESERQAKNVWDPSMGSPKTPGDPVGLPKKSVKESMSLAYERNNMPPKDLDRLERWAAGSPNRRHFSLVAKFGIINDMNLQQTLEVLQNFDDEDYASQYGASEESGSALYNSIALFNAYENVYDAWIPPDFDYNEPESVTWDEDYTGKRAGIKESMAYDVWNHQIEKMINESLTVSTTQNDTGDDSVSVTASGEDAADIMALLRNAGLGGMGPTEHQEEPEQQFSNYGVPISAEHHDSGIANHGKPSIEVISAGDEMGELMQALSSIASKEDSDYADEEEVDEGNAFTGALKDTPKGGKFEVDGKEYTDTSSLEEGHGICNECGNNMYEGDCGHNQMVDEAEDDAPAAATAPAGQAAMSYAGNQGGASSAPAAEPAANNQSSGYTAQAQAQKTPDAPEANNQSSGYTAQAQAQKTPDAPEANNQSSGYTAQAQAQKTPDAPAAGTTAALDVAKKGIAAGSPAIAGAAPAAGTTAALDVAKKGIAAGSPAIAGAAPAGTMQNAAATMRAAQGGASPTQSAAAGTGATNQAAAAQAQKQAAQNKAGSAIGAGYAKASTSPSGSTAAMPGSQVAAAKPAAKPASNNQSSGYTAQSQAQKTPGAAPTVAEEETNEHLESARPIEEELANGADDRATQDIDFMTRVISGGLNKEKVQRKNGYQFADNPLAMKESKVYSANDLLHDYRKLSGLE